MRRRRRRGRDRPAGGELALEQVPRPGPRRRRAADPAPQRLQDRQPDACWRASRARSCAALMEGYGHRPIFVEGDEPADMHRRMAAAARRGARRDRRHPATRARGGRARAPAVADDRAGHAQGLDRPGRGARAASHQVPLAKMREQPDKLAELEAWMRSYRPEELFDDRGTPRADVLAPAPEGERRMSANPHANGGLLLAGPAPARLPRLRRRRAGAGRDRRARRRACWATSCATSCAPTRTPSASSGRTRPPPTGSPTCSRSRAGRGWRIRCRPTTTSPRTAA